MATQKGSTHSVGNLNSSLVRTVPEVIAGKNVENYTLVEVSYINGERVAETLKDSAKEGFLACAVEILYDNEPMKEFYVGQGEYFRIVHLDKGVRFETSAFTGVPAVGKYASFDPASEKFLVEDVPSVSAKNVFQIVDVLEGEYGFGLPMVRLEVQ